MKYVAIVTKNFLMQKAWERFVKYANNTTKNVKSVVKVSR